VEGRAVVVTTRYSVLEAYTKRKFKLSRENDSDMQAAISDDRFARDL
jgi:hypothetical protein